MYRITIKGTAKTTHKHLVDLDGIDCQDEFSEYFNGDESYAKDITNGYMKFKLEKGELMTITTYDSKRELNKDELKQLADYTQGQWSDGIGEGLEQEPCCYDDNEEEIFVSAWHPNQEVSITQEEV